MADNVERDRLSGVETTGHEWDGLKELNNPLPKWWLYVLYATIAWSVVYWILYPAWPLGTTYTAGLLGYSSRDYAEREVAQAEAHRAEYFAPIADRPIAEVVADEELLTFARNGGRTMFLENCAPCHGPGGQGRPGGYPVLADDAWLWGGSPDAILQTIRYGIRSDHLDTRYSEMPQFGAMDLLSRDEIAQVSEFVLSLSGRAEDTALAEAGQAIYLEQCGVCHGDAGGGNHDLGAPALNDQIWLYGGDRASIRHTIHYARNGVMPAFAGRLTDTSIKILAAYVHDLGGGQL